MFGFIKYSFLHLLVFLLLACSLIRPRLSLGDVKGWGVLEVALQFVGRLEGWGVDVMAGVREVIGLRAFGVGCCWWLRGALSSCGYCGVRVVVFFCE